MMSVDDGIREFDFEAFERVMSEMKSGDTTVGGILGAMIYQIEETNKKNMDPIEKQSVGIIREGSQSAIPNNLHKSSTAGMLSINDSNDVS